MGTLEKMQAAGIADDDTEVQPTEEDSVGELVLDDEPKDEAVVAEDLDDPTDETADGGQNRQRVEVPKATLSQLRRTRREARQQVEEKDHELNALRGELNTLKKAVLKKPQYADFTSDEAFEKALLEYHALTGDTPPAPAAQPQRRQPPAQAPSQGPDFSAEVNEHLDRAEALGVDLAKFAQAERAVRTTLGDLVTDALIASIGDGSEKAVMLIGSKPDELARVQRLLAEDKSGLKVVSHLTRLAARASVKGKPKVSGAPKPSRSPNGGGNAMTPSAFDKKMDGLEKKGDVQGMVELRRAQRKAKAAAK